MCSSYYIDGGKPHGCTVFIGALLTTRKLNPLPVDPFVKVSRHVDAIFGAGVSGALPDDLSFEFSRRTGRIKNFSLNGKLLATLRTDGGLALTIEGARHFVSSGQFRQNCVEPVDEAVPFVSEGRSLFCRHVLWCGQRVHAGSDVAVLNGDDVIAVGMAVLSSALMGKYNRGVAVKVREGIKGREA
jgi:conserved protein with predicted RNA binding PUA domain